MTIENVFFFGAGTSYGSDVSNVPPLGADLFAELCRFSPHAWGLVDQVLADQFRDDFELGMTQLNPPAAVPLLIAMAEYFYTFSPSSSSLYMDMAARIKAAQRWSGAICSINYERLVELSLLSHGIIPTIGGEPTVSDSIELCLPHGCCHLYCEAAKGRVGAVKMNPWLIKTSGPVIALGNPTEFRAHIVSEAFPPVMSFFAPNKHTTSGHSWIQMQRDRWSQLAAEAQNIIVVGVKVRQHDAHIWDPIGSTNARIIYCCGAAAAAEYRTWSASVRNGFNDLVFDEYFRDRYADICAELKL